MIAALFYFTGSYNTKKVVEHYRKAIEDFGSKADIFPIESFNDKNDVDVSKYDRFGIFYPIHGFSAPKIVRKFAKKLSSNNKTPYFLAMVSGEPINLNHNSADALKRILKKKFLFESEFHYVLGYNMIFRHTEKRAFEMYDAMEKIVPLDVKEYMFEGKEFHLKRPFMGPIAVAIIKIQFLFYPLNGKLFKVNKKKCIKCFKCVENCPVKNIECKNGKFKFHNRCMMCTRCSFNCPASAISIGILNAWKVNKPYAYKPGCPNEKDKHKNYCKKAYERYFENIEKRLNHKEETTNGKS